LQLLQLGISIWQRKKNLDTTGDPWNGRTLEWSVPSPAPFYNFAVIPTVHERDPFWEMKQGHKLGHMQKAPVYADVQLPKNSGLGIIIAGFAFLIGFGLIWHIWWLAILAVIGAAVCVIMRASDDDTEYTITASQMKRLDAPHRQKGQLV
jgi:cytochrome o ubiquinol oxidase subunit 1